MTVSLGISKSCAESWPRVLLSVTSIMRAIIPIFIRRSGCRAAANDSSAYPVPHSMRIVGAPNVIVSRINPGGSQSYASFEDERSLVRGSRDHARGGSGLRRGSTTRLAVLITLGVQLERATTTLAGSLPSFGIRARAMRSAPVPGTRIEVDDGPHFARRGANCCGGSGKVAKGGVRRQPDPLLRSSRKAHRPMTRDHTARRSHSPSLHADFAGRDLDRSPQRVGRLRQQFRNSNRLRDLSNRTWASLGHSKLLSTNPSRQFRGTMRHKSFLNKDLIQSKKM
jgi:hypothetical protein